MQCTVQMQCTVPLEGIQTVYRGDSLDFGASRECEGFNSFQSVLCGTESILFADGADFYQVLSKSQFLSHDLLLFTGDRV